MGVPGNHPYPTSSIKRDRTKWRMMGDIGFQGHSSLQTLWCKQKEWSRFQVPIKVQDKAISYKLAKEGSHSETPVPEISGSNQAWKHSQEAFLGTTGSALPLGAVEKMSEVNIKDLALIGSHLGLVQTICPPNANAWGRGQCMIRGQHLGWEGRHVHPCSSLMSLGWASQSIV